MHLLADSFFHDPGPLSPLGVLCFLILAIIVGLGFGAIVKLPGRWVQSPLGRLVQGLALLGLIAGCAAAVFYLMFCPIFHVRTVLKDDSLNSSLVAPELAKSPPNPILPPASYIKKCQLKAVSTSEDPV